MPLFDEREKSAERKFEHDQELAFKIAARRNKLLGLWLRRISALPATRPSAMRARSPRRR